MDLVGWDGERERDIERGGGARSLKGKGNESRQTESMTCNESRQTRKKMRIRLLYSCQRAVYDCCYLTSNDVLIRDHESAPVFHVQYLSSHGYTSSSEQTKKMVRCLAVLGRAWG